MADRESSGCLKFFLIGCAVCVLLAIGLAVGGYYLVTTKGLEWAASLVTGTTEALLEESGLPDEEKQGVRDQIARATDKLEAGEFTLDDLDRFGKSLDDAPFVGLITLAGFEHGALVPSGLSAEEKAEGSRTVQRLQLGLVENLIEIEDLQILFGEPGSATGAGSEKNHEWTDDDVRTLLSDLETKANEAEIPDATYRVDYVTETRKAVDLLLGEETGGDVDSATP